jgi:hypothetical protein
MTEPSSGESSSQLTVAETLSDIISCIKTAVTGNCRLMEIMAGYGGHQCPDSFPFFFLMCLYKRMRSSGHKIRTDSGDSCPGDLSLLSHFVADSGISIACTARTVPARAEPPEPRPLLLILLGIGGR